MIPTSTPSRPAELAPSAEAADNLSIVRIAAGLGGLLLATLGIVSVVASQWRQVWISEGWGYVFAALGVALLVFLAIRDADIEIRRSFGGLGAALLLLGIVVSLVPGKPEGSAATALIGYRLMPWGFLAAAAGLAFLVPFVRNETDAFWKDVGANVLLATGGILSVLAVALPLFDPTTLLLHAPALAVLGLGYLAGYFAEKGAEVGHGYLAALGLGVLGAVAVAVAVGASIGPTVLYEGPAGLKNPNQSYDLWKVVGRALAGLLGLTAGLLGSTAVLLSLRVREWPLWVRLIAAVLVGLTTGLLGLVAWVLALLVKECPPWVQRWPLWVWASLAAVGMALAWLFVVATFATPVTVPPKPYLVPYGVLLAAIGLLYFVVAVGLVSDSQFVVLTRRELAGYVYTPIGYIILLGMAAVSAIGYWFFVNGLLGPQTRAVEEPIVRDYVSLGLLAALQSLFLVPAITMRAFSEEKRTGTLEVLLTAPVGDLTVLLSKFAACWLFYMLSWVPAGLYLIALRVAGGQPFDFKPLLSYYMAVGASGVAFVAVGLFNSALTKNQIVAAVLTAAWMFSNLLVVWVRGEKSEFFSPGLRAALGKLDFYTLWNQALGGSLPVADLVVALSLGVFWLFMTAKVLEIRKWS